MTYTANQWILFFFFYCFCGWVWESCFVSLRKRHWVNRGFLHGPILPIYGFGAIIILMGTLPVRENVFLTFLIGMAAATGLEYVSGVAMEALFHVRYWDYSDKPLNLHGHICLLCSLGWGAFSVLLVKFVHPPVERLCLSVPYSWVEPIAYALVIGATVDTVQSFHAAMDMRGLLMRMTAENERLRRLAKRPLMEHMEMAFLKQRENLEARKRALRILRGNPSATTRRYEGAMRALRRLNETKTKREI